MNILDFTFIRNKFIPYWYSVGFCTACIYSFYVPTRQWTECAQLRFSTPDLAITHCHRWATLDIVHSVNVSNSCSCDHPLSQMGSTAQLQYHTKQFCEITLVDTPSQTSALLQFQPSSASRLGWPLDTCSVERCMNAGTSPHPTQILSSIRSTCSKVHQESSHIVFDRDK